MYLASCTLWTHNVATVGALMKTSALRIRIEPRLHDDFIAICKDLDLPASQVIRKFMKEFVEENSQQSQEKGLEISKRIGKN